ALARAAFDAVVLAGGRVAAAVVPPGRARRHPPAGPVRVGAALPGDGRVAGGVGLGGRVVQARVRWRASGLGGAIAGGRARCWRGVLSFFFSSRRRHTRWPRDWSSDVCYSDLSRAAPSPSTGRSPPRASSRAA